MHARIYVCMYASVCMCVTECFFLRAVDLRGRGTACCDVRSERYWMKSERARDFPTTFLIMYRSGILDSPPGGEPVAAHESRARRRDGKKMHRCSYDRARTRVYSNANKTSAPIREIAGRVSREFADRIDIMHITCREKILIEWTRHDNNWYYDTNKQWLN